MCSVGKIKHLLLFLKPKFLEMKISANNYCCEKQLLLCNLRMPILICPKG